MAALKVDKLRSSEVLCPSVLVLTKGARLEELPFSSLHCCGFANGQLIVCFVNGLVVFALQIWNFELQSSNNLAHNRVQVRSLQVEISMSLQKHSNNTRIFRTTFFIVCWWNNLKTKKSTIQ